MMPQTKIRMLKKIPELKDPIFIEGLPGVGNVGRIAAGYLVEQLGAEKFADLFSSHFMPFVLLHQSSCVHVLKNEFYYWKAKKKDQRDLIILVGDSQSVDPAGHYEIVEIILDFLERLGVKDIITIAGLGVENLDEKPKVIGAASDQDTVEKYKKYGIDFDAGSKVGTIVGASGLFIGLCPYRGMNGLCLLGETSGMPIIPDPRSAEAILNVLINILNIKIDMSKIKEKVKDMESFMDKIQKVQTKAIKQMLSQQVSKPSKEKEELTYIG